LFYKDVNSLRVGLKEVVLICGLIFNLVGSGSLVDICTLLDELHDRVRLILAVKCVAFFERQVERLGDRLNGLIAEHVLWIK